jgi:hypothetical protein
MLIKIVRPREVELPLTQLQKMATDFLPLEQVKKFAEYPQLIEPELMNEARQPEMENVIKDLFNALHERNPKKLLKVLQGDKQKIFYAYKRQLESLDRLTEREAKALLLIRKKEISLISIVALK